MAWNDSEDKTKIFLDKKIFQWAKNNPEFKKIHTNSKGGSDSTQPDIEIFKKNKIIFNIEIKEDNSQIGQFVIIPDNSSKKFVLGDINVDFQTNVVDIANQINFILDYFLYVSTN